MTFRNAVLALLAIAVAMPAVAQTPAAYHLVITYTPGGVTSIPYPSVERCERARMALEADLRRRIAARDANAPPGAVVVGVPYHLQGACVPG